MKNTIKYASMTGIVAATLAVFPASAQLGLGRVTGSATSTVQGTANATVAQPGVVSGTASGAAGSARRGQAEGPGSSLNVTQNAALSSRIGPLLPSSTTLPAAATGFRSDSDFIATLHAAHNLNVPFEQMKAETTGKGSVSLGAAIHKLRPDLDDKSAKENSTLAQHQSERDIRQASMTGTKDHVAARVVSDNRLAARANPLLPPGQSLSEAAAGFKDEDQFMSTLHAANDNGIAYNELKDRVTAGQSLGAAIHYLKPGMDSNASAAAAAGAEAKSRNDKVSAHASASASGDSKMNAR